MSSSSARSRIKNPLAIVLILSGLFFILFLAVSATLYFTQFGSRAKAPVAGALFGSGSVGVVELNGVILDSKKVLRDLERFEEADSIKAVVLRLNSPGGSVAPSQEIYEAVRKYKKPLVVSMASVAASGAFYIACGAKKVYANAGTITGSIGVIMQFANLQKLYEWAKISRYSIKTGKFKDVGAEYREMSAEERGLLQGMVDDVLMQFKTAVAAGRQVSLAQVTAIADGRIFSGAQAKAYKMVDELGTLEDAVADAGRQAGIKGKPHVIYPEKPRPKLLDLVMGDGGEDEAESRATALAGPAWLKGLLGVLKEANPEPAPGVYWLWSPVN